MLKSITIKSGAGIPNKLCVIGERKLKLSIIEDFCINKMQTVKGNNEGITTLVHSIIPAAAPFLKVSGSITVNTASITIKAMETVFTNEIFFILSP